MVVSKSRETAESVGRCSLVSAFPSAWCSYEAQHCLRKILLEMLFMIIMQGAVFDMHCICDKLRAASTTSESVIYKPGDAFKRMQNYASYSGTAVQCFTKHQTSVHQVPKAVAHSAEDGITSDSCPTGTRPTACGIAFSRAHVHVQ